MCPDTPNAINLTTLSITGRKCGAARKT